MSSTTGPATDGHPFHHVALVYHTAADYVAGTVSFVRSALSRGSPVLVVVPPDNLDLIRTALGDDTRRVSFADMTVVGRNPAALLSGVVSDFVAAHPGQRTAIIGEPVWPERTEVEYPACVAHEALVNTVLAGHDLETLCLYDARRLDTRIVADAYRTHPLLEQRGKRRRSTAYTDPLALVDEFNLPLPPSTGGRGRPRLHRPVGASPGASLRLQAGRGCRTGRGKGPGGGRGRQRTGLQHR